MTSEENKEQPVPSSDLKELHEIIEKLKAENKVQKEELAAKDEKLEAKEEILKVQQELIGVQKEENEKLSVLLHVTQ